MAWRRKVREPLAFLPALKILLRDPTLFSIGWLNPVEKNGIALSYLGKGSSGFTVSLVDAWRCVNLGTLEPYNLAQIGTDMEIADDVNATPALVAMYRDAARNPETRHQWIRNEILKLMNL